MGTIELRFYANVVLMLTGYGEKLYQGVMTDDGYLLD